MSVSSPAQSSKKARVSAARLAAVQAVYQMMGNDQRADAVIADFKDYRLGKPVDGQAMVMPERELFEEIVAGVDILRPELETLLIVPGQHVPAEPLLRAIMLCGTWELKARTDVDAAVIISDYLHVTHAFFDQGEAKLINGTLDRVARAARA